MKTEADYIEIMHDLMMASQGANRVFLELCKNCTPTVIRLQENVRDPDQFADLIVGMLKFTASIWVSNVNHLQHEGRAEVIERSFDELRKMVLNHSHIKSRRFANSGGS